MMTSILIALAALAACTRCEAPSRGAADPEGSIAASERAVTFEGEGGVKLAGVFSTPARAGAAAKVPAVVILAGSGPTDRDGNQGTAFHSDLYRQLAEALAAHGVACLRYDKRGVGASGKWENPDALAQFVSWRNFVSDAEAAYRFAQRQPDVDSRRVALLGHSEGGLLALQAAYELAAAHQPAAALVLVSTPGRRIDEVIHDQLVRLLKLQHATAEQTSFFLDKNASITAAIRETGKTPPDVPPGLAALYPYYIGPFFRGELAADPVRLATEYGGPVLIVQGEKDVQVSPSLDGAALDRALARRKPDVHDLYVAPDVSHNMKRLNGPDDAGVEGPVDRGVVDRLIAFLTRSLVSR